mmetsp:Transcript_926/g.2143  ORF Transcript_926/g.2143 Transcript_926/m.2143 type:complete len:183 (-) Transcript_926:453-1001(-)|eukprot:jgi/Tetstr1/426431/TSEL_001627.t1
MGVLTTTFAPTRVPVHLRTGTAGRGRSPVSVSVSAASGRNVRAAHVASQQRTTLTSYPGEDAPGTGRRVLPPLVDLADVPSSSGNSPSLLDLASAPASSHRGLSSEECYRRFPGMARASCPLWVEPGPHGGVHLKLDDTEGPGSGKRVRPGHAHREAGATAGLPFFPDTPQERRKLVEMRRP